MGTIDCHVHLFPPSIAEESAEAGRRDPAFGALYGRGGRLVGGRGLRDYMGSAGIERAVVVGFPFSDEGLLRECNDYLLEACRTIPGITALTGISPAGGRVARREAERCLSLGARGVGEVAFYGTGMGGREVKKLAAVAGLLREADAILMLHVNEQVGHAYPGKTEADFDGLVRFAAGQGGLKLLLAHLGGGLCFYEFMPEVAAALRDSFYDTAAAPFLYSDGIYRFIDIFLADKVLFGSDFPLLGPDRYESGMSRMSEGAREKLRSLNARRLFGNG